MKITAREIDWLKLAGIPHYDRLYVGAIDKCYGDGVLYLAVRVVDKTNNHWDVYILSASGDGKVVQQLHMVEGRDLRAHAGGIALEWDAINKVLDLTITEDIRGDAMFPPLEYILDPRG